MTKQIPNISIIIPVFNEEKSVKKVIADLTTYLKEKKYPIEIIIVNDGSTDKTKEILQQITHEQVSFCRDSSRIRVISHPYNKGYGAALKTGVKNAKYDWVLFYDGDGQHQPEYIEKLIKYQNNYDMIIGARKGYKGPMIRQPGKKLLHWLAEYLVQQKIPDLNSGLRLMKKSIFEKFAHLLPNGFSLSTTITLAAFRENFNVKYVPIKIRKRQGKSTVCLKDGLKTIMLILRIITLFSPLRIFLPVAFGIGILAIISLIYDIVKSNITDATILLFSSTIMLFFFGLLADQIAAIRREIKS